jgi:hypothetical protein
MIGETTAYSMDGTEKLKKDCGEMTILVLDKAF